MDGCFRLLMDEIHRYEGTINQFRGDGVMALFGAPIAHEDHAQRACHAALAVQKALKPYSEKLQKIYGINFTMRIGLNSGSVVVGAIGDDLRMDYTAQGDTANLASRMESNAEPGSALVSDNTYRLAREFFEFAPPKKLQVKGKQEPVETHQLIRQAEVETRIAASAAKGLTRFVGRGREIETLKEAFEKVQSGEGRVVGLVGEAGVGKSRLLLEFRKLLPKGRFTYFEGRCIHYGGSMPYLPVLDVLRSFIGVKEGEQEQVIQQKLKERVLGFDENLRYIIPPFQELLSLKVDDEAFLKLEPKQKREKTFEAIRDLLIRGSQDRPLGSCNRRPSLDRQDHGRIPELHDRLAPKDSDSPRSPLPARIYASVERQVLLSNDRRGPAIHRHERGTRRSDPGGWRRCSRTEGRDTQQSFRKSTVHGGAYPYPA